MVREAPKSAAAEAIRSLRTNLQFAGLDAPLQTVMVTSAGPGEGKTALSGNLAASIAMSGIKTILVGVDLRKPMLNRLFSVSNNIGLTNVLSGNLELDDAFQDSGIENLSILASGPIPPNPAEILGSKAMANLVEELRKRADMIIFDATPVIAVTDAVLLSHLMDGVLVVVAMKQTPRELVRRACEELRQAKANIVGVVANRIRTEGRTYYYYTYYSQSETNGKPANGSASGRVSAKGIISKLFDRFSSS